MKKNKTNLSFKVTGKDISLNMPKESLLFIIKNLLSIIEEVFDNNILIKSIKNGSCEAEIEAPYEENEIQNILIDKKIIISKKVQELYDKNKSLNIDKVEILSKKKIYLEFPSNLFSREEKKELIFYTRDYVSAKVLSIGQLSQKPKSIGISIELLDGKKVDIKFPDFTEEEFVARFLSMIFKNISFMCKIKTSFTTGKILEIMDVDINTIKEISTKNINQESVKKFFSKTEEFGINYKIRGLMEKVIHERHKKED